MDDKITDGLPATGFVRLADIIRPKGPLPISRASWYVGIKSGRFPKPLPFGSRTAVYRVEDIRALIQALADRAKPNA